MYTIAGASKKARDQLQTSQKTFLVVTATQISSKLPLVGRERLRVGYRDIRLRVVVFVHYRWSVRKSSGPVAIFLKNFFGGCSNLDLLKTPLGRPGPILGGLPVHYGAGRLIVYKCQTGHENGCIFLRTLKYPIGGLEILIRLLLVGREWKMAENPDGS